MRKKYCFFIAVLTVFLLFGCAHQDEGDDKTLEVTISPEDATCFDLVQTEVSEEELLAYLESWPSVTELNQKFPIECFRHAKDVPVWEELIWATYKTDQGWVLVYFHDDMGYSAYRTTKMESKTEALEQVKVGMSVDEVEALDPAGDYWFRHSNMAWVSYHYTEDGTEYYVAYDGYFNVIEKSHTLI